MVVTGIYYALALTAVGAALGWLFSPWCGIGFYVLAAFCLWFFRDPDRVIHDGPVAVSPADGKVVLIRRKPENTQVCIFLNVFDVHVNRAPIAGKVVDVVYKKGKFLVASKEEASYENEMNTMTIDGDRTLVKFSQTPESSPCHRLLQESGDFVTAASASVSSSSDHAST